MKSVDRFLRDARIARAKPFVRKGDVVLDVGSADGEMFKQWGSLISHGIGIDPILTEIEKTDAWELYPGLFPQDLPSGVSCDVITMLAVLEHITPNEQAKLGDACYAMLKPQGRIVITVPSPRVDDILHLLDKLHLIDGMSMHEHYGFQPQHTPGIFPEPRFRMVKRGKFQFGLNNLFVFEKQ